MPVFPDGRGRPIPASGEVIVSAVRAPFLLLCIMLGIYVALEFSTIPEAFVDKADKGLSILAVFAVALVTANILTGFARIRADRIESVLPVTSITENIIRIVVYGVGTLIVLNQLGISIAPILATLGVGGLAVALGAQGHPRELLRRICTSSRQSRSGWGIT